MGLPVLRTLSLCTCCRQYPGAATGRRLRSSHPAVSAFPEIAVGSACTSTFSRLARRSLALRPAHSRRHLYVTSYTEGFSHFVTSMTAPVASGWSVRRVGLAPTGKRRLLTAHAIAVIRDWNASSPRSIGAESGNSKPRRTQNRIQRPDLCSMGLWRRHQPIYFPDIPMAIGSKSPQLHQIVCTSWHDLLRDRIVRHSRGLRRQ